MLVVVKTLVVIIAVVAVIVVIMLITSPNETPLERSTNTLRQQVMLSLNRSVSSKLAPHIMECLF